MMRIENLGDETVIIRLDDDPHAPEAAFMTDEAEVVGFLGGDIEIAPAGAAAALVRDRGAADGRFLLGGTVQGGDTAAVHVRLSVPITDE